MSMKSKSRVLASLALGLAVFGSSQARAGMVAYWNFDSNVNDSTANANNGTIVGSVPYVAGQFSSATSYGTGGTGLNYITVPDSVSLTTFTPASGFTVSLWVKAAATTGIPISRFTTSNGVYGLYSDGKWYAGTSGFSIQASAGAYGNSTWNNIVLRWTGTNVISYLNGVQQASAAMTSLTFAGSTGWPLLFGNDNRGVTTGKQFVGLVDDAAILNAAQTVAQTKSIYNVGTSALGYSMADMNLLFTLYANATGTTTTSDGKTWQYNADGLTGAAGTLVGSGPDYSVIFSDTGAAGVSVIPEPATLGLLAIGGAMMFFGGRKQRA